MTGRAVIRHLLVLLPLLAAPAAAWAQTDADPDALLSEVRSVTERVQQEADCLDATLEQLRDTLRLMREARDQARASSGSADARRDAREALRSLAQRAVRLERRALTCRTSPSTRAASDGPPEGVRYVDPPADPRADAVARPNPATRVLERDVSLGRSVRAVVGEQVDGRGRLDGAVVRAAVRRIAPRLSRCYDQMVDRRALVSGQIILTFTVTASGRVARVRTEGSTFGDGAFARCVRQAGTRLGVGVPALGGDATFAYTLQFPGR